MSKGVRHYQRLLQKAPEDARAWYGLGLALAAMDDLEQACTAMREAGALSQDPEVCTAAARFLASQAQLEAANEILRKASMLGAPVSVELAAGLLAAGISSGRDGQHEEAIRILNEARQHAPNDDEILANLGTAHLALGQVANAIEALAEAVRLRPNAPQARCMLGVAFHSGGETLEALEHLREACRLQPDWAPAHYNLGRVLMAAGDLAGARAALAEASRLAPHDPEIRSALDGLPREEPNSAGFTGDLETFHLPELLEFLRMQRSTGTLVLSARRGAGLIRLFEGQLISANAPATVRLGEILVQRNVIDRAMLSSIVDRPEPELLGVTLMKRQMLGVEQLRDAMTEQLLAALTEMMGWTSGQFAFHARAEAAPTSLTFDIQTLMLEAMRRADEAKRDRAG